MVLPVTGPYSSSQTIKGPTAATGYRPDWVSRSRTWRRQRRPYTLPLPFTVSDWRVSKYYTVNLNRYKEWWQTTAYTYGTGVANALKANAFNQAYSRLINGTYGSDDPREGGLKADAAELGAALGERKQSLEMIATRSTQLLNFARKLRKLDFRGAEKVLGSVYSKKPVKGIKGHSQSFANNFLEYSFGWAPLIGDIGNAIDTLQNGVPAATIRGRGKNTTKYTSIVNGPGSRDLTTYTATYRVQLQCQIRVNNPNLFLANQLGLVNPASVAWELVPFSFVVDYFVNVNQFLASFTDFWGADVINPFETDKFLIESSDIHYSPTSPLEEWAGRGETLNRVVGPFPGPQLRVRKPWQLKPQRAATSVSLLLQMLKK